MTFNDIFKSSFLENVSSVSILDIALTLVFVKEKVKQKGSQKVSTFST